jgi:hypothetical protein
MRICVLGNSDTVGRHLGAAEKPWPLLVQEALQAEFAENVTVDSWRFAPYRPGALEYALSVVDQTRPDFVILPIASYWCAFTTVERSVEKRFGSRAAQVFALAEALYWRRFGVRGGTGGPGKSFVRSAARRLLGASPVLTISEFVNLYSGVLRELSRREDLQVIVYGDRVFMRALSGAMPGIERVTSRIESALKEVVTERRFRWVELTEVFGAEEATLVGDGIHMTPDAHARVAEAVLRVVREEVAVLDGQKVQV